MLKVKAAWKGSPKNDVKDSTWTQSFFNSLSSQIKSDGIPSVVKLDDVNNKDINPHITLCCCNSCGEILKKPIKVLKCEHRFCLNCLAVCLSGKNEKESQCPACTINFLKAEFKTVPRLICKLCCHCLKYNAKHVVKSFSSVHTIITIQNTIQIAH